MTKPEKPQNQEQQINLGNKAMCAHRSTELLLGFFDHFQVLYRCYHWYVGPLSWGSLADKFGNPWWIFFLWEQHVTMILLRTPPSFPAACNLHGDTLWGTTRTTLLSVYYSCVLVTLCTRVSRVMDNLRMEWGMYEELLSRVTLMSFRRQPVEFFLTWVKPEKGCS